MLRRIKLSNPHAKIFITGCYALYDIESLKQYADGFISMQDKKQKTLIFNKPKKDRVRTYIKIQDGCDEKCTYCISSRLRGKPYSKPMSHIEKELKYAYEQGFKEVVLTGLNIMLYGLDINTDFKTLLKRINTIKNIPEIRLSSLEPRLLDFETIDIIRNGPFKPHFHIPVQTFSNKLLSIHKRGYTDKHIAALTQYIEQTFSRPGIGADIIAGLPFEDKKDHKKNLVFLNELPFTYLHIFTFSKNPGTPAANMPTIKDSIVKDRIRELKSLDERLRLRFKHLNAGKKQNVLMIKKNTGLSDNYLNVNTETTFPVGHIQKLLLYLKGQKLYGKYS